MSNRWRRLVIRFADAFLLAILRRLRHGTLEVVLADGGRRRIVGVPAEPAARIDVVDSVDVLWRILRGGGVGFAEAYLHGSWTTPDLADLLEVAARNHDTHRSSGGLSRLLEGGRALWARINRFAHPTRVESMDEHYNLGNEFYAAWLDPSMTYSAALFVDLADSLEAAQRRKYQRIAEHAGVRTGQRVLEIGCGWGGFAEYAASELGARVTAVTLSSEQEAYVARRMELAGVSDLVDVRRVDFRKLTGTYDAVVSIEMIESVDETVWPALFSTFARSLEPGGRVGLQSITIDEELFESLLRREEFIKRYIFPGGALPSLTVLQHLAADHGLEWVAAEPHGDSYALTLASWSERFSKAWRALAMQPSASPIKPSSASLTCKTTAAAPSPNRTDTLRSSQSMYGDIASTPMTKALDTTLVRIMAVAVDSA